MQRVEHGLLLVRALSLQVGLSPPALPPAALPLSRLPLPAAVAVEILVIALPACAEMPTYVPSLILNLTGDIFLAPDILFWLTTNAFSLS